jgi:site-specific DNA-cytosine methylase
MSKTTETQQKLTQESFQTLICSAEDFLVRHSQSLEKGEVSKIPEARCFLRLQGFPDNWTAGFSDTQRYKMMGNAVTTNVIKAIASKLK